IVCGDMIENSKPAPDIYLKACEMIGVKPKECYALEDSKNGLLSAYRAGCKPIMVPDLWQPDEEIMKVIVAQYDDLEQVKVAFENGDL
nr:HAD family hydrolase [Acetatifactor sp.]